MAIPVIDIFAGPGGLGEGFSSRFDIHGNRIFNIKLSIEKDPNAHETLRLRSFFRQFPKNAVPDEYYEVLRSNSWKERKRLINRLKTSFKLEWEAAEDESWCFELPYPEEFDKRGIKKGGYTTAQIEERNLEIDERINAALGGSKNFLLIGGPPCQAYSLVGRARNQGIRKEDHRVHLYKEYLRIIAKHQPAVFVMENVKGLLSSEVDGAKIFNLIKEDLSDPSSVFPDQKCPRYKIFSLITESHSYDEFGQPLYNTGNDYLIKSEQYGVPQKRHRVILLGVRQDIKHQGEYLEPKEEISLESVIDALPKLRSGINRRFDKYHKTETYSNGNPKRLYINLEDSDDLWRKVIQNQIDKLRSWGDLSLNGLSNGPSSYPLGIGGEFVPCDESIRLDHPLSNWYLDPSLKGVPNHESRSHLTQDLMRYMFAGLYVEKKGDFPRLKDYAEHHQTHHHPSNNINEEYIQKLQASRS